MASTELVPRRPLGGIVAVWVVAALAGVGIAIFVPSEWRSAWMTLALAGCVVLGFAVQLGYGFAQRYVQRVALSALGALVVLGVVSIGFGFAALIPG